MIFELRFERPKFILSGLVAHFKQRATAPAWACLVLFPAFLSGCGYTGAVKDFSFTNALVGVSGMPEIAVGERVNLYVTGTGQCDTVRLNFGTDLGGGERVFISDADFTNVQTVNSFAYPSVVWRGVRAVTVEGVDDRGVVNAKACTGFATKNIFVTGPAPTRSHFGEYGVHIFNSACVQQSPPLTMPRLRKNTEVRIKVDAPDPTSPVYRLNEVYRGGTGYTADGDGVVAGPSFPFEEMSRYSIVFKVGTQRIQGQVGTTFFQTNQAGQLEFCVNTDNASGENGTFMFEIAVNESNASP